MGRPLKIAKAQAVLTVTDTALSGSVVTISGGNLTTSPTVGIIAGMPFVVASNVGGLIAGTIYYVNTILSNTTFNVSATQLSVQPQVMATLSNATGQTVKASFGVVDAYFNNPNGGVGFPATNSNTYSVVGGNTAIVGPQVLAQVAIGINGTGTIYTDTGSADVYGVGTDFANTLSTGSAVQIAVANNNGRTDYVNLGFVSSIGGYITEAITDTETTGSFVITSGDATNFVVDQPIVFDADIGGLTANTVYWMLSGANTTHFQVSASLGGAAVAVIDDTVACNATQDEVTLTTNATVSNMDGAAFVYANDEAGFIVRQKGKQKYLVQGGTTGLQAQCYTANVANTALTANTMRILATYANTTTQTVQSLSDHNAELFTATSGPVATGNIVLANATPVYVTFNTAETANANAAIFYPVVTIANA